MAWPRHAKDFDFARSRRQQAFENFDGGGLAGAIRPEQTEALAGQDVEVQSADRLDLSVVGLLQIAAADGNFHIGHDTEVG